jgi:putative inorganic carbon (HCO3(-)) transporter
MRDILVSAIILVWLFYILRRPHYGRLPLGLAELHEPPQAVLGIRHESALRLRGLPGDRGVHVHEQGAQAHTLDTGNHPSGYFRALDDFHHPMAFYSDLAWVHYNKVIKIQMGTFMTLMLITSKERLRLFVWIICLSIGYYGIKGGIFTIVHGGVYRVQGPASTFFEGNNEMGLVLIMTVPFMRYLHLTETRYWVKLGLAGAMFLTTIAAFGTQSRGALVALAAMATMLWLKSRNKLMTALLIGVSMTAAVSIMPAEWFERMNTIKDYKQDESALGRINAWWTAFNVAKSNVTGGGFEMFRPHTFSRYAPEPQRVHDVHSIYFEVMGEHGFPGFFMFMALMAFTWFKASGIIRACKRDPTKKWASDLAAMTQVSMIGYASGGAFLGLAYFDYYYHLIALVVITWTLVFKPDFYTATAPKSGPRRTQPVPLGTTADTANREAAPIAQVSRATAR